MIMPFASRCAAGCRKTYTDLRRDILSRTISPCSVSDGTDMAESEKEEKLQLWRLLLNNTV